MSTAEINHSIDNISTVAGRYVLGHQGLHPGVDVLACRLRAISPTEFVAAAPVVGAVGEAVSASFAPFGSLHGHISRHVPDGFAVALDIDTSQDKLVDQIEAFRHRPWRGMGDRRAARRFMPAEPRSVLILGDGTILPCLIVDYSVSGAAISADTHPPVGTPLTIGRIPARVVRLFDVGFAVRFDAPQSADEIETRLETPPERRDAITVVPPRHVDTSEPGEPLAEGYGYD